MRYTQSPNSVEDKNINTMHTLKRIIWILAALCLFTLAAPPSVQAQGPCTAEDAPGCTHGLPTEQYNKLLAEMQAHPEPIVASIPVDHKLVDSYTFYRILPGAQKYDAPNGNVIGAAGDGFNFVSVYGVKSGFARMRDGTWVLLTSLSKTFASEFSGVQYTRPLKYPMAWIIQAALTAPVPGGVLRPKAPQVKRYQRVYLYAVARVGAWNWYLIGPGMWIEQRKLAKIDPAIWPEGAPTNPAPGSKWVAVDVYEQTIKLYEGTTLIAATLVSSGLPNSQTNVGQFKVYERRELTGMVGAMGDADGYSLPQVPYVLFFDRDISLHGAYWHDAFGTQRSHGCVNLSISDSRWIYEWAGTDELNVIVWNSRN